MKLNIQEVSDYDYELGRINYEFKKERSSRRKGNWGYMITNVKGSCWRRIKKGVWGFLREMQMRDQSSVVMAH